MVRDMAAPENTTGASDSSGEGPVDPDLVRETRWYSLSADEALEKLGSSAQGLDADTVAERRDTFGPNRLPRRSRTGLLKVVLRQFRDPLVYVLLAAGSVSLAIQQWANAGFIFAVLIVNSVLGTLQEYKAESGAEALEEVVKVRVRVRRDGDRSELDSEELVPGDVVLLEAGDSVPADGRLLEASDLQIDESLLTGESEVARKEAGEVLDADTSLGDRVNMIYAGTLVLDGRATAAVCTTAGLTEVGRIAESLGGDSTPPPLVLRLRRFTRLVAVFIFIALIILTIGQVLQGAGLLETLLLASALAVSAIPAGLPIAITVALSIATSRMADRNVIVRLLPAVEGLGAATVIASDKTGTLTANQLTVRRVWVPADTTFSVDGEGLELQGELRRLAEDDDTTADDKEEADPPDGSESHGDGGDLRPVRQLALTGVLCNSGALRVEGDEIQDVGDKVDVALLVLGAKLGIDADDAEDDHPEVAAIAFKAERRYAATFNEDDDGVVAHVKGAAEVVLPMCPEADRRKAEAAVDRLADDGYRVLALARGRIPAQDGDAPGDDDLRDLDFLGLVGMIDPVRDEVPDAIERCRRASVDVRMVTGDHPRTALAIARRLGIADSEEQVIAGRRLESDDKEAVAAAIREAKVFARVEPIQKTRIVGALQDAGDYVAVTGDGVNDAPALQEANIGVAMGKSGTDVARRAADLILTDDNFASIVGGIEEGRIAYDNVRKVTWLLISTGVAEVLVFFLSLIAGLPLPLTIIQLLWLNLVTNGIQDVALAFEHGEPGVLDRPPRPPKQGLFDRQLIEETAVSGGVIGVLAFVTFYLLLEVFGWGEFEARNALLLLMVLFENIHALTCRSETQSVFRMRLGANRFLVLAVLAAQAVHISALYIPGLSTVLETEPVSFTTWLSLLGIALGLLAADEIFKAVERTPKRLRTDGDGSPPDDRDGPARGEGSASSDPPREASSRPAPRGTAEERA